ncbi:MAG TPA: hypothetical protein DEF33_05660, partial [Clostridiales bacterium]|nr:hypothetical protein [Clostridiales bacterium]
SRRSESFLPFRLYPFTRFADAMFLRADTLPPHRTIDYIPHSPSVQCIKPAVCPKYEFIRKTRLFD